jgi:predicted acyltransferase
MRRTSTTSTLPKSAAELEKQLSGIHTPGRLLSLDVFRGLTVAAMILVNNPGDWGAIYAPLRHAEWHGATPTDLVFPFFLFIVGVSITFSLSTRKYEESGHAKLITKIAKRSLVLFGLGLFLHLFPSFDFATVRIPGVLQRIAIVFLVCAILFLKTSIRSQAYFMAAILLSYWFMMALVPVPGVGIGYLEPGKNLAAWLDNLLLHGHLWKQTNTWDPEGILSTLPAIATGISGMLAGQWLRFDIDPARKMTWLFVAANLAIFTGFVWDWVFPINKALWTSSFVLYTTGLALHVLAVCYWLIDIQGFTKWTKPFVVYGVNAITVFFLSGLIPRILSMIKVISADGTEVGLQTYLYNALYTPVFSPVNASLAWAVSFVLVWLGILWIMYNKRIIIKV